MKRIAFITLAAVLSFIGFVPRLAAQGRSLDSQSPELEPHPIFHTDRSVQTVEHATDPWSVIGQWHYASDAWRGMVDIRADGTFSRADGQGGKWKLGGVQDNFVLILKWDHFPQETVAMVSPAEFRGDSPKGEIIVRRLTAS